jgi:tetratricopeptide (TPR) repeat protein
MTDKPAATSPERAEISSLTGTEFVEKPGFIESRIAMGVGILAFLWAAAVYFITLTPTVPFWDSGEFIAVSKILGVPHPPGTPFYVLIGRMATLIPWASIAQRVNGLSALSSALAVMITYFAGLRLIRLAQGKERTRTDEWIAITGAFVGAALLAFSDSFWENSIEAEVYSMMSLAQILVLWLGLRWWEAHEKQPTAGPLLVAVYVMWLSVGLHLGVGIMGAPLLALVWVVDKRAGLLFTMPFMALLLIVKGLEFMAGGILGLLAATFLIYAAQRKLSMPVAVASAAASLYCMSVAFGDKDFSTGTAILALASIAVPLVLLSRRTREGKIILLSLALMGIGYSTHLYLPIRAAQHPAINEGNPSSWERLRDLLERKQYGPSSPFERRAPLEAQLNKEFWRYFQRQWPLFPTDRVWGSLLPLLLGLVGAWYQYRRERTSFLVMFVFVGLTTAGMIAFLNFTDHEVRERDYFFQSGYHAYALWIGLGAAWLLRWVADSFTLENAKRAALGATAGLMVLQPVLVMRNLWYTHDRRGNEVARDYAYNMLAPLAPNGYVFTNGDNDTFPLWYIQQVENFRKDVRVVNLSLLNTDWYIFQLRDEEPKVPISLSNEAIDQLGAGAVQDAAGNVIYTNQFMVAHIMKENRNPDGSWKKPPYFAVTVPEHMGFDKQFSLEGLVYRVNRDTLGPEVDVALTRHNMYDVFRYGGLFKKDGSWDSTVYKDENAATLSRNYAAAHMQLALVYEKTGDFPRAISELERVERMFPGYVDVLVPLGRFYLEAHDTTGAVKLFERLVARAPTNSEAHYYLGITLMFNHQADRALQELDRAIELDHENFYAYVAAYSTLNDGGQRERALSYLERWLKLHPEDNETRQLVEGQRGGNTVPLPRPPLPGGP